MRAGRDFAGRVRGRLDITLLVGSAAAVVLAAIAALAVVGAMPARSAPAPDAPTVVLVDPTVNRVPPRLGGIVTLTATATPAPGRTIVSVQFESAPSATGLWVPIGAPDTTPPYAAAWPTDGLDGPNDLRAVATDDLGVTGEAVVQDVVVDNNIPQKVALVRDPGLILRGTVPLTVTADPGQGTGLTIVSVAYERQTSGGPRAWEPIGVSTAPPPHPLAFDTTTVPDGVYDLRVTVEDDTPSTFVSPVLRNRRVDNTAPTAVLDPVTGRLTGPAVFSGAATDGGSGIAAVRFERAAVGTGAWTLLATDRVAPFRVTVQTANIPNGRYDLRLVAIDRAGNRTSSAVIPAVDFDNPPPPVVSPPGIQTMAVPVRTPTILGVANEGGSEEVWAFGFTTAAPAVVDGQPLPYTNPGDQLVLLRYQQATGWRISDVLRTDAGDAFVLPNARPTERAVAGFVAPSGEGWIAISFANTKGIFHRVPGGRFVLDSAATATLDDLLGIRMSLKIRPVGGGLIAALANPDQRSGTTQVTTPAGAAVTVSTRLTVGQLDAGGWSRRAVTVPSGYVPRAGDTLQVAQFDRLGPAEAWAIVNVTSSAPTARKPAFVMRDSGGMWTNAPTGIDAIDLPEGYGAPNAAVDASNTGLLAVDGGAWVQVSANPDGTAGRIVARLGADGRVAQSWCGPQIESDGCTDVIDPETPATLPTAVFGTGAGATAVALSPQSSGVVRFDGDRWSRLPTAGMNAGAFFTSAGSGWLTSTAAVARWQRDLPAAPLVPWPQANRDPLTAAALPPGGAAGVGDSGALAVGLSGAALHYEPGVGWTPDPVPTRAARLNFWGVAFARPNLAFAVGQAGAIMRWDGTTWALDPQSSDLTENQLNAVAFAEDGRGWAVGRFGTILHFDGSRWILEQPPADDAGINVTSVTVSGDQPVAVIGGNLIVRRANGTWQRATELLPDPPPPAGELRVVAGLPDGGLVAAGRSIVLVRDGVADRLAPAPQPIEGIAVAAAAARVEGRLRPLLSIAPPASDGVTILRDVSGQPSGDGELLRQLPDGTWQDLSLEQDPGGPQPPAPDGRVKTDPVLAIAAAPNGQRAWAVGGYAGSLTGSALGTDAVLGARATGWRTSSIWRYDADGRQTVPGIRTAPVEIPAQQGTVSFAFFSDAMCRSRCSEVLQAQPDVNLQAAARQIAAFARQPGGPLFAVAGGNLRGPHRQNVWSQGLGDGEFSRLPGLLEPLGNVPLYAAAGPRDLIPGLDQPSQQWTDVFASAPAPFGGGAPSGGIAPAGRGFEDGPVNRYYAFDATQNGATIRVVVIDNSAGSLERTSPGQTAWLRERIGDARGRGLQVVVIAGQPLRSTSDGDDLVALFVDTGVAAVFTGSPEFRLNERRLMPEVVAEGAPQVPVYEGAVLGYQEAANNGVAWYHVSIDTTAVAPAPIVRVDAVPIVDTIALKPLQGLAVNRSQTLQFQAIARRPVGTLATPPNESNFPGIDNYVAIPAPGCGARPCVVPSYRFTSSDPTIGDFVSASATGSRFPQLSSSGRTTPNPTSGLFCGFNTGTTTVTVTTGLVSYSLPVNVRAGGFGPPCGTVTRAGVGQVVTRRLVPNQGTQPGLNAAPPTPPATSASPVLPSLVPPPPAPPPVVAPPPAPIVQAPTFVPRPVPQTFVLPPPPPPPIQPIPPGGATAPSAASAPRREKAHKHASQSAFTIRPSGIDATSWFFPGLVGGGVLSLLAVGMAGAGAARRRRDERELRPAAVHLSPPRRR